MLLVGKFVVNRVFPDIWDLSEKLEHLLLQSLAFLRKPLSWTRIRGDHLVRWISFRQSLANYASCENMKRNVSFPIYWSKHTTQLTVLSNVICHKQTMSFSQFSNRRLRCLQYRIYDILGLGYFQQWIRGFGESLKNCFKPFLEVLLMRRLANTLFIGAHEWALFADFIGAEHHHGLFAVLAKDVNRCTCRLLGLKMLIRKHDI